MPFRSRAQQKKIAILEAEGKLPDGTFNRWQKETGKKRLPERVRPKKKKK